MKPDTALIRLTVGCGSAFESSGGGVVLIDEQAFEPVVAALADAGVSKDDIYLNTFSGSSYGPSEGAAVITFKWRQPQEVTKILTTAQRAVRKETDDNRGLGGELGLLPDWVRAPAMRHERDACIGTVRVLRGGRRRDC